jgi:hypothetical protein
MAAATSGVEEYRAYLGKLFEQLNSEREEMERLRPLPQRRLESVRRIRARGNSGSLIVVERLLGEQPADRRDLRSAPLRRSPGGLIQRAKDGAFASAARPLGLAARLNECVDRARGPYLARMDADDLAYPDRLARQMAFLGDYQEVERSISTSRAARILFRCPFSFPGALKSGGCG